jgi:hypothetical protein
MSIGIVAAIAGVLSDGKVHGIRNEFASFDFRRDLLYRAGTVYKTIVAKPSKRHASV